MEIGAGSGQNKQNHFDLRDRVARYVGIDPDASVLSNPFLHESHQARAESLPFADATFDIVFHNYVAEHFELPETCNREIARVLKPGGLLLFQTPNRYYYACLAAQLTPQPFHEFFIKRMASGRTSNEVFPTFYRLNDTSAIRKQLHDAGFAPPRLISSVSRQATSASANSPSSSAYSMSAPSSAASQPSAAKSSSSRVSNPLPELIVTWKLGRIREIASFAAGRALSHSGKTLSPVLLRQSN